MQKDSLTPYCFPGEIQLQVQTVLSMLFQQRIHVHMSESSVVRYQISFVRMQAMYCSKALFTNKLYVTYTVYALR